MSYFAMFCYFFKQKTAYEVRISDWSSDVCSSDLEDSRTLFPQLYFNLDQPGAFLPANATSNFQIIDETPAAFAQATYDFSAIGLKIGRATCRERVCQ